MSAEDAEHAERLLQLHDLMAEGGSLTEGERPRFAATLRWAFDMLMEYTRDMATLAEALKKLEADAERIEKYGACAYCGESLLKTAVQVHITTCEKHPLAAERRRWEKAREGLRRFLITFRTRPDMLPETWLELLLDVAELRLDALGMVVDAPPAAAVQEAIDRG